jgi:beta-lactam-binding protein with PASTA domain
MRPAARPAAGAGQRMKAWLDERRLLKYIVYTGLGGFLVGYLFITLLFFPGFGRSAVVNVPDLRGKSVSSARRALEDAGLVLTRGPGLNHPRMAAGHVVTQVPLPGQEAGRGSAVRVFISDGPDRRRVPSIEGMGRDDAIRLLQRMGFQVRLRTVQDASDEGTVLRMDPQAGTAVPVSGVVVLAVSAGPPKIVTPSVLNGTSDQAASRLEAAGLRLGRVLYDSTATAPLGDVVAQSPAAGDSIRQGGSVRITVSGHDPRPPPPLAVDSAAPPPAEEAPPESAPPAPPPRR